MGVAVLTRLDHYQGKTELWLAVAAFGFLVLYSVDVLVRPKPPVGAVLDHAMTVIWVFFGIDFLVRLVLAEPRLRWFVRHLPEAVILVLPVLRPLRLLSLAVVVGVLQRVLGHNIRGRVIAFTACGTVLIVYAAALAMLDAERYRNDKIDSFPEALWWAFTTVTTVGYGDTVPVTGVGRVIAGALMLAGVSLLAVVTATLASWIVERVAAEDTKNQAATARQIEELRDEVRKLTESLERAPYREHDGRGLKSEVEKPV